MQRRGKSDMRFDIILSMTTMVLLLILLVLLIWIKVDLAIDIKKINKRLKDLEEEKQKSEALLSRDKTKD